MLEHPEIGWIERTGYPSWMQEPRRMPGTGQVQGFPPRGRLGRKGKAGKGRTGEKMEKQEEKMEKQAEKMEEECLHQVAQKLAGVMGRLLDGAGDKLDARDLKALAGAMKDLQLVVAPQDAPGEITVRFLEDGFEE